MLRLRQPVVRNRVGCIHALARRLGKPAVVVAAHGRQPERVQQVHGLARPQRSGDAVAEIGDPVGAAPLDIGEQGFEGGQVGVNFGDDCEAHRVLVSSATAAA